MPGSDKIETRPPLQDAGAATVDAKTGKEISSKVGHYCRKILMKCIQDAAPATAETKTGKEMVERNK